MNKVFFFFCFFSGGGYEGNAEMRLTAMITSIDQIRSIETGLKLGLNTDSAKVINYVFLRVEDAPEGARKSDDGHYWIFPETEEATTDA